LIYAAIYHYKKINICTLVLVEREGRRGDENGWKEG